MSVTGTPTHTPPPTREEPPQGRTLTEANRLAATFWARWRQAERERAELARANATLTRRRWWEQDVDRVPHKDLSATEKLVLRDLYTQQEQWTAFGQQGPQRVWCEGRARALGLSADTYGRALQALDACGAIARTAEKDAATGNTRVSVTLRDAFWRPADLTRPEPRQQGGDRRGPRCGDCPPDTPVVEEQRTTTRWICQGCGTKLDERQGDVRRRVLPPDPPPDDTPDEAPPPPAAREDDPDDEAWFAAVLAAEGTTTPGDATRTETPNRGIAVAPSEGTHTTGRAPEGATQATDRADATHPAPPQPHDSDWPPATSDSHALGGANAPLPADGVLVTWLLHIAGDLPRHIVMPKDGPKKYDWRPAPLTRELLRRHLDWEITLGSEQRWASGRTFALCWDADTPDDFARHQASAQRLLASGARPVLERSPSRQHPGGGRLWLFFQTAVAPGRAWATAVRHAPDLAHRTIHQGKSGAITEPWECWPTLHAAPDEVTRQVRLPGGYFQRADDAGPCPLALVTPDGPLHWAVGREAVALTYRARTPANWVTEPAPPAPAKDHRLPPSPPRVLDTHPAMLTTDQPLPAAATDAQWQTRTRGRHHTWHFWVTDKEAIAWFNARHDVRELLPTEANGYARATWRGERTPSVAYVAPNGWIDYGHSTRADGRRDGGDAFDALCRREGLERSQALQNIVLPALLKEASALLEAAARSGVGPPGWVAAMTAPAGWAHYRRLARSTSPRTPDD